MLFFCYFEIAKKLGIPAFDSWNSKIVHFKVVHTTLVFYLFFPEKQLFNMGVDFALFKGVERINLKQHFCINTDYFFFLVSTKCFFSCYMKF